jgi:hypothetical protein
MNNNNVDWEAIAFWACVTAIIITAMLTGVI